MADEEQKQQTLDGMNTGETAGNEETLPEAEQLRELVRATLRTVYDPEIPVNIYDLGLIYEIEIDESKFADISMTLTSPACPVAGILPGEVETKVNAIEGLSGAAVEITWDPPWNPDMMSEEAKLQLGF